VSRPSNDIDRLEGLSRAEGAFADLEPKQHLPRLFNASVQRLAASFQDVSGKFFEKTGNLIEHAFGSKANL
jgi:hypothetical protein